MQKPTVPQIILGVWTLVLAIAIIPLVWLFGDQINGTYLGPQLLIGSLGFVIIVLQVCQFVIVAPI